jgi:hypothetical protein
MARHATLRSIIGHLAQVAAATPFDPEDDYPPVTSSAWPAQADPYA